MTIIGVIAYGSRLAGVKTKKLSTAFSLYNILNLFSRFANMLFLPLIGAIVEDSIRNNTINILTNQFYIILLSVLIGTIVAIFLLPTSTAFFELLVNKLSVHRNLVTLFIKEFNFKNIKNTLKLFRPFKLKDIKNYKITSLQKGSLLLNPIIVSLYTVGYLAALYAGALTPENRLVASQLSSTVNGIGTILLYIFIDPIVGIISDEVMSNKREEKDLESLIFYFCVGRVVGVLLSFTLLIPLAKFISQIAILI